MIEFLQCPRRIARGAFRLEGSEAQRLRGSEVQGLKGSRAQGHNCRRLMGGHEVQRMYRYRNPHRLDCDFI